MCCERSWVCVSFPSSCHDDNSSQSQPSSSPHIHERENKKVVEAVLLHPPTNTRCHDLVEPARSLAACGREPTHTHKLSLREKKKKQQWSCGLCFFFFFRTVRCLWTGRDGTLEKDGEVGRLCEQGGGIERERLCRDRIVRVWTRLDSWRCAVLSSPCCFHSQVEDSSDPGHPLFSSSRFLIVETGPDDHHHKHPNDTHTHTHTNTHTQKHTRVTTDFMLSL